MYKKEENMLCYILSSAAHQAYALKLQGVWLLDLKSTLAYGGFVCNFHRGSEMWPSYSLFLGLM